ncbi:MAG TPA: AAA family ATPase [Polyangiaceae bacterium]|nr:AAA family ATPase [Polyangiaceae bacterium]
MRRLHATNGATCFLDDSEPESTVLVTVLDEAKPPPARLLELETEHRLTRDLNIPGVRKALRRGEVDGKPALYSSWFAGNTLEEIFAGARPPLERVLDLLLKAARLVSQLHAARVLHGRIGPQAFRVDASLRELELSGLGFGTRLDSELPQGGEAGELTPYASPEQTGRMNRPIDWRSDLYSLGATFYLMLTGSAPFAAGDAAELAYYLIAVEPTPPATRSPDVPQVLSEIVLKLLAKDAEDRYQSADALCADLEQCRKLWQQGGQIPQFALAQHGSAARFELPRKLYGREEELGSLLAALERTSSGASELVLVGGVAGAGKTALVREVLRPLALRRGRYVEGKFDQFQRELPFSAFAQAFSSWVHHVLSESEDELARLRSRVKEAVGELGGLLTRLVPDLELVIGAQPPVPEVGPSDALHRFQYVLRRFLQSISDEAHPLALFVDDLQWADPASLELLATLMSTRDAKHLLVIGAYRSEEVGSAHALTLCLAEMDRERAPLSRIELGLLGEAAVTALVADALFMPQERAQPLAHFVWSRTQGNALFVRQLLRSLYEDGALRYSHVVAAWEWELGRLDHGQASLDVLALFGAKTARLDEQARRALVRGAYLGNRFDVAALATTLSASVAEVGTWLEPAVREGLLVPIGTGHRYVAAGLPLGEGQTASYVFPHDRVQQAVYSLVPEPERAAVHLAIGQKLSAAAGPLDSRLGTHLFLITHQLNQGRALVSEPQLRRELSLVNLEAGLLAKRSAAYAAALEYFSIGLEVAGPDSFQRDHQLALQLHSEAAECAYLAAAPDKMEQHTERVLSQGKSVLEKAPVYLLLVDAYTSQNRLNDALAKGLAALAELGVAFPRSAKLPHIILGLSRTKLRLSGKNIPALAKQRPMTDPHKQQAMLLLERMVPPAYMSGSPLFPLFVFAMVDLSVKYGNSPLSAFGYASFAITLSGVLGDIRSGTVFGKLGLDTLEETHAETFRVKVLFVIYVFIRHWTEHLASCQAPLLVAYRVGMEAGNLVGATWSAYYRLLWMYFTARPLGELEQEAATYSAIFHDLGQTAAYRRNDMLRQVMLNLAGRTADPVAFSGETYRDAEIETLTAKGDDATSRFFYYFNKQMLCFLFGQHEQAVAHGDSARALTEAVIGLPDLAFWAFWDALSRTRWSERCVDKPTSKRLVQQARAQLKKLAKWGEHGPMNYQHKHDLVLAELLRVEGEADRAREKYDRAIEGATEQGYLQEAALAEELAARFHLQSGRRALAAWYLERARRDYLKWGAIAKADALEREHGELLSAQASTHETPSRVDGAITIDLTAVVKATQAISGEIVLERLAAKLLEIALENAGAERGALVLYEGESGHVVARKNAGNTGIETGLSQALEENARLPLSVLNYVARSKRPLVVDDAEQEPRFARDPEVMARRVRSILCAPIVHHNDLIASVYLDSSLSPRVFTPERLEILQLLGGQIAISLENARLYGNLQASLDKQVELTRAYSRFTPRSFLDILDRESILDVKLGDHRHGDMTVMFLDIRDYTRFSEQLSTSDNFRFLNGFFRRMTVHVARQQGVVATFTGDGFSAFFPRHPEDAYQAAVEIQKAVRAYNAERQLKGRVPIAVGLGLHTGPLMLGVIGDQDRLEASLISDTVNTASRMEGLTKEFRVGIVASESTVSALPEAARTSARRVGNVRVKGKSLPTRVYDCFAGDAPEAASLKRATLADFATGLEAWQSADFAAAVGAFERVIAKHPADGTAQRYLSRAREQIAHGADPSWTGVEVMDKK